MPPQRSNKQNTSSKNALTPYKQSESRQADSQSDKKPSSMCVLSWIDVRNSAIISFVMTIDSDLSVASLW